MKAIETSYIAVGWSTWFVLFPVYFIYYGPQFVTLASVFFIILTCALWRCTCSHDPYGLYNCSLALYKSSILFIKVNMLFLWVSFLIINYFIKVNMLFILAHIFYIIFHKLYIAFLVTARLIGLIHYTLYSTYVLTLAHIFFLSFYWCYSMYKCFLIIFHKFTNMFLVPLYNGANVLYNWACFFL